MVERLGVDGMLVQFCSSVGVGAVKPTIEHSMEGLEVFAMEQFRKRIVLGTTIV